MGCATQASSSSCAFCYNIRDSYIYFPLPQSLFSVNPCQHPIVILKDVHFDDLQTVVQFMYNGVVNVSSDKLPAVLKVRREKEFEEERKIINGDVERGAFCG